ncbi:HNH endonuclease signature motif containing protein [Lysinibacillus capsici]|uniref:HNH endonuclease n=1 Tax=Lysinibacillus capsici TaxID=2115968 RepID=UPI003F1F1CF9
MALIDKPEVKYALWQAYQRRCAICYNDLFNYTDLEIDHIIPKSTQKDEKEFEDVKRRYELPTDFNIDGLENLRPAHHFCNNKKRNKQRTKETMEDLLITAQSKIRDVKKHIRKFEEDAKYVLSIEAIRKQLIEGKISTIEQYVDQINNHTANFGIEDYKSDSGFSRFSRYSYKTVVLEGYLPRLGENRGSCLFTFNSFYIRGSNISLGHKEILSVLYPGNNTPIEFDMRKYIVANLDNNNYVIQLGNSRFNLNLEEVKDLCVVIDKFIIDYINALKELEGVLECEEFTPHFQNESKYNLIKVNMDLWLKILEFSRKYDYEAGDSDWNIFDSSGNNTLKVYIKNNNEKYNEGYKCVIHSFIGDPYSWTSSNYVWLLWYDVSFKKDYGLRDYWTVKQTYNWLLEDLLPKVIQECIITEPKRYFKRKKEPNTTIDISSYFYNGESRYFSPNQINDSSQLIKLVNEIQLLYSINEYVYIKKNALKGLYRAIIISLKACKSPDYHYICSNLNIDTITNRKEIECFLQNKIDDLNDSDFLKIYSFNIDNLFRILYSNLCDMKNALNFKDIKNYLLLIEWYIEDYNTKKLVEYYK